MNISACLERIRDLSNQIRVLEVELQGLRDDLREEMLHTKVKDVKADGIEVKLTSSYMRESFNSKGFREAYPDLYDDFTELKRMPQRLVVSVGQ